MAPSYLCVICFTLSIVIRGHFFISHKLADISGIFNAFVCCVSVIKFLSVALRSSSNVIPQKQFHSNLSSQRHKLSKREGDGEPPVEAGCARNAKQLFFCWFLEPFSIDFAQSAVVGGKQTFGFGTWFNHFEFIFS